MIEEETRMVELKVSDRPEGTSVGCWVDAADHMSTESSVTKTDDGRYFVSSENYASHKDYLDRGAVSSQAVKDSLDRIDAFVAKCHAESE